MGPKRGGRARISSTFPAPSVGVSRPWMTSSVSTSSCVSRSRSMSPGSTRMRLVRSASGGPKDAKREVGVEKKRPSSPSRSDTRCISPSRRWAGVP